MSRKENIKKNLIFNVIKFTAQLVLKFVLRTVLIYIMGSEYLGLNGLFSNIFSFLNLAELGIGSAIVFSMYKPIAENDVEKIKALQSLYKKFYLIIAIVVGVLGLALLPFIEFFIKGGVTVDINIYALYIMYLINTLVGYFSAHKRSLLFAYQRNDVENKVKTFCLMGMTILQIIVLCITKNYYLFFIVNIIFTIIECILVQHLANKLYPEINGRGEKLDTATKKEISKNVVALSLHKIGGAVIYSTDNILISTLLGVVVLGAYSNYYLVVTSIISVFTLITDAITGSVGNLIVSTDKEYVYSKYKQINFLFSVLSAFCTVCMLVLFQPFIKLWTGGGVYLLEFSTVVLICISFYIVRMRSAVMIFKDCAGLFWYNRFVPVIEAVINIVVSIVLGVLIGINGIIFGTIISAVLAPLIAEPYVLYKHYFKKSIWGYLKRYLLDAIIMVGVAVICLFVCSFIPDGGVWWLVVKFAVCICLCALLLIIAYAPTKEFKECFAWVKNIVKNFVFHKKAKKQVGCVDVSNNECENNCLTPNEEIDTSKDADDNKEDNINKDVGESQDLDKNSQS